VQPLGPCNLIFCCIQEVESVCKISAQLSCFKTVVGFEVEAEWSQHLAADLPAFICLETKISKFQCFRTNLNFHLCQQFVEIIRDMWWCLTSLPPQKEFLFWMSKLNWKLIFYMITKVFQTTLLASKFQFIFELSSDIFEPAFSQCMIVWKGRKLG